MSHELWATYSVNDHLTPRRLAADIMLFDRLVFPVPETAEIPGRPDQPGPVEWTIDPAEWKRWQEAKPSWNPAAQQELLKLLAPVVRKVPWGPKDAEYRKEAANRAATALPDYAFQATRSILTRDLPAYVTGVAAVGPSYGSLDEIERDLRIETPDGRARLPGGALGTVLAWEFLGPDLGEGNAKMTDAELLKETCDFVTGDKGFRDRRRAFLDWQQGFLKEELTDRESIERAAKQMKDLLADANNATAKLAVRKSARYVFRVAPPAVGLAAAVAGLPGGVVLAAGVLFLALGGVVIEEFLFKAAEQGRPPPTAFVHDARRRYPWKKD